jgi:hypothetical protein
MDRVSLLFIRSRPVLDFHWLESAACSRGVNELAMKLKKCDGKRIFCRSVEHTASSQRKVNFDFRFAYGTL